MVHIYVSMIFKYSTREQVAYERGANYIYRVNDDSEMMDPWARSFSDVLEVCLSL